MQETFTRAEYSILMEILRSRVHDIPSAEGVEGNQSEVPERFYDKRPCQSLNQNRNTFGTSNYSPSDPSVFSPRFYAGKAVTPDLRTKAVMEAKKSFEEKLSSSPICDQEYGPYALNTDMNQYELGDTKADTTEHIVGERNEDSSDQLVTVIKGQDGSQSPVSSPTSQICVTSYCANNAGSCEFTCISEQSKAAVVDALLPKSNDQLFISNDTPETQKLRSFVDDSTFVPDSPNSSAENLNEHVKNSQEMEIGLIEVERHDDPSIFCNNDSNCLETSENGTERRCEEECEKVDDTSEAENGKPEHCLENNQTTGASHQVEEDSCMAENFNSGDNGTRAPEKGGEVSDSQEKNILQELGKQNIDAINEDILCHASVLIEVISLDSDTVQPKRSKISKECASRSFSTM